VRLFDTSVIIDARDQDSPFHTWAKEQIAEAVSGDGAAANSVVVAEASVRAKDRDAVPGLLEGFGMTLLALPVSAAVPAAKAFAVYLERLKREGKLAIARMPLPDFLIGAHAQAEGLQLVTRDPDRVRTYFQKSIWSCLRTIHCG
jgi:predicted nucleic acid-binding protein